MSPTRRTVLRRVTAAGATFGVAGCLGGGGETPTDTSSPTASAAATDTRTTTASATTTDEGTTTDTGTETDGDQVAAVTVKGFAFDPVRLSIDVGATVEWTNRDSVGHDVTGADFDGSGTAWAYASGTFGGGESVRYTFDTAGAYEYYCSIHGRSTMCGVVVVGDVDYAGDLPCTSGSGGDTDTETDTVGY